MPSHVLACTIIIIVRSVKNPELANTTSQIFHSICLLHCESKNCTTIYLFITL